MSNVSLTANILTSKVNIGNAARLRTYRIQDPSAQMCPVWNGMDLTGRQSGEYGFYTKVEGCNSAQDRIAVENTLRPQYVNFIPTLNAEGISGYIYDKVLPGDDNNFQHAQAKYVGDLRLATQKSTGQFGVASPAESRKPTSTQDELHAMEGQDSVAAMAQNRRVGQKVVTAYSSHLLNQSRDFPKVVNNQYQGVVRADNTIRAPQGSTYARLADVPVEPEKSHSVVHSQMNRQMGSMGKH